MRIILLQLAICAVIAVELPQGKWVIDEAGVTLGAERQLGRKLDATEKSILIDSLGKYNISITGRTINNHAGGVFDGERRVLVFNGIKYFFSSDLSRVTVKLDETMPDFDNDKIMLVKGK